MREKLAKQWRKTKYWSDSFESGNQKSKKLS